MYRGPVFGPRGVIVAAAFHRLEESVVEVRLPNSYVVD